jgi:pimeloyl-ACP methyl ester carboxylesterase
MPLLLTKAAGSARQMLVCLGLWALLAPWSGLAQNAALGSGPGGLTPFTPCRIEHPARVATFKAECAWLTVPENRDRPKGRQLRLHIARVPAISARKQADPLLVLAGGPGMAAHVMYAGTAAAFGRINQDRDILLIDQRGTGRSAPLECAFDEQDTFSADEARMLELVMACRDELARRADLAQYTTSVAVRDLEAVRVALGLGRINLYGVSYGTRVAQHYLRRYPANTRRMILDGVVAPDAVLPEGIALDAESALLQILGRCRTDARCAERFKDPVADYRVVRARVAERPVALSVPDPRTGEMRAVIFDRYYFAAVLRLASYTPQSAALLPLALWQAARQEDFRALAAQALLVSRPLQHVMAMGMHNSVMCAEDDPRIDSRPIDRNKLASTYIGTVQLDAIRKLCAGWPRGPVDEDLFTAVSSVAPVLLLSGGADPVTPPLYARRAMAKLSNARHIEVPAMGHGQLGLPCMGGLMAEFIDGAAPQALDASCLERVRPMPFFLTPAGPAP